MEVGLKYCMDSKEFFVQMLEELSIGAENLSEAAKTLEFAAKNNSTEEILANHAVLMATYKKVCEEILSYLSGAGI